MAGACLLIYFFTNGMAIFVPQNLFPRFMETFAATEGEVSLTVALMFGLSAILAPGAGALIDRFGALRVIRIGLVIMAICFTLYPFAQSIQQLYILHTGLAFGMVLGGLLVNVVLLSNWFITRRGAVIGLLLAMSSLSGLLLPNLISPLVNDPAYGWRWGVGSLAGAFWILAVLPGFFLLKERPSDVGQFPDGADALPDNVSESRPDGISFRDAIRSRTLYVLAIGSACLWYTFQGINSQVTIFLELETGMVPQQATLLYSMIFGFSIAGKFLFGAISDRFQKRHVLFVTSTLLLAGCLLVFDISSGKLALASSVYQLMAFTFVFGLGYGGSFTMIQLVCVESFGQRSLGKILGIVIGIDSIGGMLGTIITGQLKTTSGSYLLPFSIIAMVAAVALFNVLLVRPVKLLPHTD
jgi:MFS family permease